LIGQYILKANERPPETHCILTAQPPRDKPYRALLSDQIKHNPSTCPSRPIIVTTSINQTIYPRAQDIAGLGLGNKI
jgi:hypothetical protein